jgi:glutathione peroxidase-family protein
LYCEGSLNILKQTSLEQNTEKAFTLLKKERKSRLTEILYTVILYGNTAKSCPFLKEYQHLEKYYTGNLFRNIHYTMM